MSEEWPKYTWISERGAFRTKFSTILRSSFLLSSLKGQCLLKMFLQNFPESVQCFYLGGWLVKINTLLLSCPKSQITIRNSWGRPSSNQEPLFPFMPLTSFLWKHSLPVPKPKFVLYHSSLVSCKYEELECSTQFSINLPGCNNQDGFQLKPHLYFLFISWNVSRHIHSPLFFFPECFIKTSPLVICYLLHF